jgi:hypothetical protein
MKKEVLDDVMLKKLHGTKNQQIHRQGEMI